MARLFPSALPSASSEGAGVRMSPVDPGEVWSVAPHRGREGAVARALGGWPEPSRMARSGPGKLVWVGPGRALLVGREPPAGLPAALVDLSDAHAVLRLEGPGVRDVLARLVPVDLSERAFPEGGSARTLLNHMTVTLLRVSPRAWEVWGFRSMAGTMAGEIGHAMRGVAARAL
mgnify:CR=1 FL=1